MGHIRRAVILSGNLHNLGDLALLLQCAHGLREIGIGDVKVRQWGPLAPEVLVQLDAAAIAHVPGKRLPALLSATRGALVLFGGGQMARDNSSTASLASLALAMRWAQLTGGVSAVLACGIDRLNRPLHRRLWRDMLRGARVVTVRDESACAATADMASIDPTLTADLMFMPSRLHAALRASVPQREVVVAPCVDASEGRAVTVRRLASIVGQGCDLAGTQHVCVVAHDARPSMDVAMVAAIAGELAIRRPDLIVRTIMGYRLDDVLHAYAGSCLTITNRLHAAIFTLIAGAPLLIVDDGTPKLAEAIDRFGVASLSNAAETMTTALAEHIGREVKEGAPHARRIALAEAAQAAGRNFTLLANALARAPTGAPAGAEGDAVYP